MVYIILEYWPLDENAGDDDDNRNN